jgi:hypothetical protein
MTNRVRPSLPWFEEPEVFIDNPFHAMKTPAAVMAYFSTELPDDMPDLLAGIVDAGAGHNSLMRDVIELNEMGRDQLAETVFDVAEKIANRSRHGLDISEIDFEPALMKGASVTLRQAVAWITMMKLRERIEGVPVQLRDAFDRDPASFPVGLDSYAWTDIFPVRGARAEQVNQEIEKLKEALDDGR